MKRTRLKSARGLFFLAVISIAFCLPYTVKADPIAVGTGSNHASVIIEFKDTATYTFDVAFSGTTTGLDLFDIIEADTLLMGTPFTTVRTTYGSDTFIDGISFDGHSNIGNWTPETPEDWWHFWIMDPGETNWTSPSYGVSSRTIVDGASDGWMYGRAGAPVPEPATLVLFGLGIIGLLKRKS